MDKKLYDIVYNDIIIQFGAGDIIEDGDREACAEQIVEDLEKTGYRNINEEWFPEDCFKGDTILDMIEAVRKETAKEIYDLLIDETVWETDTIMIGVDWLKDKIKKYGVEVDDNGGTKG